MTLDEFEKLKPSLLEQNKEIYLPITKENLLLILKGEKTKDYRENSLYNAEKLCYSVLYADGIKYGVGKPEIKTVLFLAGRNKEALRARIEVQMIRTEKFIQNVPENFKQGDTAITIYLGQILETNYKKP